MQGGVQPDIMEQSIKGSGGLTQSFAQKPAVFGIATTMPPVLDPQRIMQRADEVATVHRMLKDTQVGAVLLTGLPGTGKSTLAALVYNFLLTERNAGFGWPNHMVWLEINQYTTVPDMIAAILSSVNMREPGFFLMKPEQQVSALLRALRRPQESAFIVLDQFELLLHPETQQGVTGRGNLSLFLDMLQTDLGTSRILLTSYTSPYDEQRKEQTRVRSYMVSRISIPEGTTLLQQLGAQCSSEEISLVWQRCGGHVFALTLFSALMRLSGMSGSFLLNSPDHQAMWSGEVTTHLLSTVYRFLNPVQYLIVRALSLYSEPIPVHGIAITILGNAEAEERTSLLLERELAMLMQLSLIQSASGKIGTPAFTIHPLLRQHTLEHYLEENDRRLMQGQAALGLSALASIPEGPDAKQRAIARGHMQVASFYRHVVHERYIPREQRKGPQDVEPIIAAIRHLCLSARWQQACDVLFAEGLHESMVQWGAWNTLIGLYTTLLPPFGSISPRDQGTIASYMGMLYGRMDEHQQSRSYFERALVVQQEVSDISGVITTLANQGELLRVRGEYDQARTNFEQAIRFNEQVQNIELQCILMHNLGLLYHQERNYARALKSYRDALKIAGGRQGRRHKGIILTNLGMLLFEQGQQKEGVALLFAALELRKELQDSTAIMLEVFLKALEQNMGTANFAKLCQDAMVMQEQILSSFITA